MMLLPLISDTLHLFGYIFEALEHVNQLLASDDQERALYLGNRCAVALVSLIFVAVLVRVREDVRVAKVRTLHVQVERDVRGFTVTCLIQVYVKLDSSLENEKYFLSVVTLLIESVLRIHFHGL